MSGINVNIEVTDDIYAKRTAEQDTNRAHIVALAVREACTVANMGKNQQDWEAACRFIMSNDLLTSREKVTIVSLLFKPRYMYERI
ncbi:hypothetical protein Glove_99g63 [Diversispora epigaea]|uniref:Uncharacterized protein n=1 Tax=Diversispora epigaea TaxID=1348612 RepID=A0A397J4F0_9GLOM|nr:hypothetical protein Glove_99g63 [Diversispora epigaea]